jgi:hypothetical protein
MGFTKDWQDHSLYWTLFAYDENKSAIDNDDRHNVHWKCHSNASIFVDAI